jgi:ABC-type antimicrobial peptide transport system permease subunit
MIFFVLLCVLAAAILGATLPILMSIRRHPIKAMREE